MSKPISYDAKKNSQQLTDFIEETDEEIEETLKEEE